LWWKQHYDEVDNNFKGLKFGCDRLHPYKDVHSPEIVSVKNSGADAILLAASLGATKIYLIGYDCSVKNGSHWHGDHPKPMGNCGSIDKWPAKFQQVADLLTDIEIINCSRQTALDCFVKKDLEQVLC